jgi:Lipocalin-like domain
MMSARSPEKAPSFFEGTLIMTSEKPAEAAAPSHAASLSERVIGTWSLRSRIDLTADGERCREPTLGEDPIALVYFDKSGNFAAQFMKRDRSAAAPEISSAGTNNTRAVGGYDAYFGTYRVDDARGVVTTTLAGAIAREHVGAVLTRAMRVDGDTLTITLDTSSTDGQPVTRTLTWSRVG